MRYQNWDVLVFPGLPEQCKIPLQEFKTSCTVIQDSGLSSMSSGSTYSSVQLHSINLQKQVTDSSQKPTASSRAHIYCQPLLPSFLASPLALRSESPFIVGKTQNSVATFKQSRNPPTTLSSKLDCSSMAGLLGTYGCGLR